MALALCLSLATASVVTIVAPSPAQAATCSGGFFCYFSGTSQSGTKATIYYYTYNWVALPALVDTSESSWNQQYSDGCRITNNPYVYLSDTYFSTRWTSLVSTHSGHKINTFNPISTNYGWLNMNNKFNDYWNVCAM
jgi:hypothetical protein